MEEQGFEEVSMVHSITLGIDEHLNPGLLAAFMSGILLQSELNRCQLCRRNPGDDQAYRSTPELPKAMSTKGDLMQMGATNTPGCVPLWTNFHPFPVFQIYSTIIFEVSARVANESSPSCLMER
jgi:hypothetical protein